MEWSGIHVGWSGVDGVECETGRDRMGWDGTGRDGVGWYADLMRVLIDAGVDVDADLMLTVSDAYADLIQVWI